MGRPRGSLHLLPRGGGAAIGDVVINAAVKQPGILQHHGIGQPQAAPGDAGAVSSVHAHFSAVHIIKAHEQIDQRGLSRARGADDGDELPRPDLQAQVVEHRPPRRIAKEDMLQLHRPLHRAQRPGVCRIRRLRLLVHDAEDPFCRRHGGLQLVENIRHLPDGPAELPAVKHEGADIAHGDAPGHIHHGAEDGDQRQRKVIDKVGGGPHARHMIFRLIIGLHGPLVVFVQLGEGVFLLTVGLQRLLPGDHLLRKAVELPQPAGPQTEQGMGLFADPPGDEHGQGHRHHKDQHQLRRDAQHHDQRPRHRNDAGKDLHQIGAQGAVDGVGIVGNAADDIAHRVAVEIAHRQIRQPPEHIPPHPVGDLAGNDDHQNIQQIGHHCRRHIKQRHPQRIALHGGQIHLSRPHFRQINGPAAQGRPDERKQIGAHRQRQRQQKQPFILQQIDAQPAEGGSLFRFHASSSPICRWLISR